MKKVVLSLALVAVLGLSFTSCKKAETEATEGADTTVVVEETTAPVADTVAVDTVAAPAADTVAAPAATAPAH